MQKGPGTGLPAPSSAAGRGSEPAAVFGDTPRVHAQRDSACRYAPPTEPAAARADSRFRIFAGVRCQFRWIGGPFFVGWRAVPPRPSAGISNIEIRAWNFRPRAGAGSPRCRNHRRASLVCGRSSPPRAGSVRRVAVCTCGPGRAASSNRRAIPSIPSIAAACARAGNPPPRGCMTRIVSAGRWAGR